MKEVLREGYSCQAKLINLFKCHSCGTIFRTDEYALRPNHKKGTLYVSTCPICGKEDCDEDV